MDMINQFSQVLENNAILAVVFAFVGGFISSFSPCSLSTLPLMIGYASTGDASGKSKHKPWVYSVVFSLGLTITFVIVGIVSTVLGKNLKVFGNWWYLFLAILLTIVSLYLFGIFEKKNKAIACKRPKVQKNVLGAFLIGILGGFFDSPCSTPILIVILTFIAQSSHLLLGILLMISYSVGHCVIIMIAGTSIEMVNTLLLSEKYQKLGKILKYIFAMITLGIALYLYYIAL